MNAVENMEDNRYIGHILLDTTTDHYIKKADDIFALKEKEILTV